MSREIKFRAWHKNIKEMCQNVTTDLTNRDYLEFMQYVGLKDKNDKEIYEGDIVRYLDSYDCSNENGYDFEEYYNVGEVKYDNTAAAYEITNRNSVDMECIFDDIEVIGNIYENPEPLKEE